MNTEVKSLFEEFVALNPDEKKDFVKQALSYLLDDKTDDVTNNHIEEAENRLSAFKNGEISSMSFQDSQKIFEQRYQNHEQRRYFGDICFPQ